MKNRETENIEHKQSLSDWKAIVESVAAFATSSGGTIVVGISPEGEKVGISIGKGTIEDLANKIKMNTDPVQLPSVNIIKSKEKELIEIKVMACPIKPVMAFGRPFKRVGSTNQRLNHCEFKNILDESNGRFWDGIECRGLKLNHIDREAIDVFLEKAHLEGNTLTVLKNLRLVNDKNAIIQRSGGAVRKESR